GPDVVLDVLRQPAHARQRCLRVAQAERWKEACDVGLAIGACRGDLPVGARALDFQQLVELAARGGRVARRWRGEQRDEGRGVAGEVGGRRLPVPEEGSTRRDCDADGERREPAAATPVHSTECPRSGDAKAGAQLRERARASCQRARRKAASPGFICGSKRRSSFHSEASSASDCHSPTPRPASAAAPKAVVSVFSGRKTDTPRMSAWNCISRLLRAAPPSTRSSLNAQPASWCIASIRSAVWKAMLSSAARAMWARLEPRVRPMIVPRAYASHCGAPSPAKAGTR